MTKKWLILGLKVAVSGALIWWLVSTNDIGTAFERAKQADTALIGLSFLLAYVQFAIGGLRWGAVLRAIGSPVRLMDVTRLFYVGAFFNQALPGGSGGDPIRMYMARKEGLELRAAINGVMLERIAAVAALILLGVVMSPFFLHKLDGAMRGFAIAGLAFLFFGAIAGIAFLCVLDRLPERYRKWRIVRGLAYLSVDTRRVFFSPARTPAVMFWSLIGNLNIALMVFVFSQSIDLSVTFLDCVVLMPPVLLVVAIPVSIGGWGVREGAIVTAFSLISVPQEGSIVVSVLLGLVVLIAVLPGGLMWLAGREKGESAAAAVRQAEAAIQESEKA